MKFPLKQVIEGLEGVGGRLLGAALAVGAILICVLQVEDVRKMGVIGQTASWALIVWVCLMECMYLLLILTKGNTDAVIPSISQVAMRQPLLPQILRPIAAVFWLSHFLFIVGLLYILRESSPNSSTWGVWIGSYLLASLLDFLAYGYVLLFVTALTRNPSIIQKLWRYRFWVSQVIAILSIIAPSFLPLHKVS